MKAREVREIMQTGGSQISPEDPVAKILEVIAEQQHDQEKNLLVVARMVDTLIDTTIALTNITGNPEMLAKMLEIQQRGSAEDKMKAARKTDGIDVGSEDSQV